MKIIFLLLLPVYLFGQTQQASFEDNIDHAYKNAMKGVYWALSNIPESKSKVSKDLINDDQLISSISLEKEIKGIKVSVKGYYKSYKVEISVYRSFDTLKADGYLSD